MDLQRIKTNVGKMVEQGAPESDIDAYIQAEGTTIDDVRNFQPGFKERMQEDFSKREENLLENRVRNLQGQSDTATNLTAIGQGLGVVGDVGANLAGSAARYVGDAMPQYMKDFYSFANPAQLLDTTAGEAVKGGAQKVIQGAEALEKQFPTTAGLLGAAGNLAAIAPMGLGAKGTAEAIERGSEALGATARAGLRELATPKNVLPDSEQFAEMGRAAYKRAAESGDVFTPDIVSDRFVGAIELAKPKAIAGKVDTDLALDLERNLGKYRDIRGQNLSIDEIDVIDKDLSNLKDQAYSSGKNQLGGTIADIQNALRGSVNEAPGGQALAEGRDMFRRKYQMEDIERIFRNAEGRPNEASIIQTGFRNLAKQARKKGSGYSKAQIEMMDKAAKGGASLDALKLMSSRLLPAIAGSTGGAGAGVAAYMTNLAAGAGATALQRAKAAKLTNSIAKGVRVQGEPTLINKLAQRLLEGRKPTVAEINKLPPKEAMETLDLIRKTDKMTPEELRAFIEKGGV